MSSGDQFDEVSQGVYYARNAFNFAGRSAVELVKQFASNAPRRRCRICFHPDQQARAQEMLIAMHRSSYVCPHRHLEKSETMTVLEGAATALLFDENGTVIERLPMGDYRSGRAFFYRMPENMFHTLMFETEWLVYLETTIGPFDPLASEIAPWAPPETDPDKGHAYLQALK